MDIFMKKNLTLLLLLSSSLFCFELKSGIGAFNPKVSGLIKYQNNLLEGSTASVDNKEQYHSYLWTDMTIDTFYTPHIFIAYNRVQTSGKSFFNIQTVNKGVNNFINDILASLKDYEARGVPLYSTLKNNIFDIFVYTDIFEDETLPTISFGAGLKHFNYTFIVPFSDKDENGKPQRYTIIDDGSASIPMLYTSLKQQLEEYPIGFEAAMKYYVFGDSDIYDLTIKMEVLFDVSKHIKMGAEIGYKDSNFNIKGNDIDNVGGNMRYQGIMGGVTASFY